ncbi:unnamed protein product [Cylindrotheca closterium]|uniref:BD-FAE-like domain-containing protein n=1 Tax=Cylindrotheca closterium TaxID=2856 RepID=A0AAD2CGS4_9STRA|nr:unnamed protein product [Cylindrotheca closterium]
MSAAKDEESLLTEKSFQLSLSPPRSAPIDTAHRAVITDRNPASKGYIGDHHLDHAHSDYNLHSGLRERLMHLVYNADLHDIPHPHLAVDSPDGATRFLGSVLPLEWQNSLRDSGGFRRISDDLVQYGIPLAAITNPSAARTMLQLTNRVKKMRYGQHPSQFIDLMFPEGVAEDNLAGMLFFVHGGAWGSGKTWFYRLTAVPFLKQKVAVAIVGYRVYPEGDINVQVRDTGLAYQKLCKEYPRLCGPSRASRPIGLILMGHSSGAHVALLFLIELIKRTILMREHAGECTTEQNMNDSNAKPVDQFVGLSGPYDISHHFDYEAARGVEELSPLKPACGYTREQFRLNSPAWRLKDFLSSIPPGKQDLLPEIYFPRTLLVHGIEDEVVPFTSTSEAARILRSCGLPSIEEHYAPKTGHQDVIVQFMLGGKVPIAVMDWLGKASSPQSSLIRSKL